MWMCGCCARDIRKLVSLAFVQTLFAKTVFVAYANEMEGQQKYPVVDCRVFKLHFGASSFATFYMCRQSGFNAIEIITFFG